jgi:hypothetical protein
LSSPSSSHSNLLSIPSAHLHHLHLFIHFDSSMSHSALLSTMDGIITQVWGEEHRLQLSRLQQVKEGRWVHVLMVDGGEVKGWKGRVESAMQQRGLMNVQWIVLTPQ